MKNHFRIAVACCLISVVVSSVHISSLQFTFLLNEKGQHIEGHVLESAGQGTRILPVVMSDEEGEESENGSKEEEDEYLRLQITLGDKKVLPRKTGYDDLKTTTAMPADVMIFPQGFDIAVVQTTAFDISDDFYLVVRDSEEIMQKKEFMFYVVMVTVPNNTIVSNPLPFVIRVDRDDGSNGDHGAALYAGIIVLLIVFFALFIPFTVRYKRRRKSGKPVCGCGSTQGTDEEKLEKRTKTGRDNPAIVIDEPGDYLKRSDSSLDNGKETIQDHMLRSVSAFHFQPKWLDPHYKDDHHVLSQQPITTDPGRGQSIKL